MELLRTATNPWGQGVLVGIGWDLVWLAIIASALFVVVHAVWMRVRGSAGDSGAEATAEGAVGTGATAALPDRIERHSRAARTFHWLMSVAMFALLITAFVPVVGMKFAWVTPHWIAGLLLLATILYHVVHALGWQDAWAIWLAPAELKDALGLGARDGDGSKPGKYPADHKLFHHLAAVTALAAIGTGVLMMLRLDTPFWAANPYLLSDGTWGVVYVVHGLAGVALIGLVTAHVYFAVRPEKRWITWSMVWGWISRERYLAHHDPAKWVVGTDADDTPVTSPGEQG